MFLVIISKFIFEILRIQERERKASKFGCYAVKTMGIIKILLRLLMAPL